MKDFLKYINAQDARQLKQELTELYTSFELVRNYYQIKGKQSVLDENLLSKYKAQVTKAIYPNKYMEGGLDVGKVDSIVKQLNSDSTLKYYIEVSLYAIEACTDIAKEYGCIDRKISVKALI
ncbi:MAG: hypothetical protein AB8G86_08670, partial [Saprospiraceae bacterium]